MPTLASFALRARTSLLAATLVVSTAGAATTLVAIDASPVSAQEMPVNHFAPEITESAFQAIVALDDYVRDGRTADLELLAWHRAITARYAAQQLGYDEMAMIDSWASADLAHQRAVLGALTQLGVPYRSNTSEPGVGFDCSGLTTFAWAGAGVELYRQSGVQIDDARRVGRDEAQPGDLVHYPGHVMMYLGVEDAIVHAPQTGRDVEIDTISSRRRDSVSFGDPS